MCHGQILTDAMRTARKDHECSECGRTINRKKKYVSRVGIANNELTSYKLCLICSAGERLFLDSLDSARCYYLGDVVDNMEIRAKEDGWKHLLAELRTHLAGLRAKYARGVHTRSVAYDTD